MTTDPLVVEALVDIRLALADAVRQTGSPLPNDRIRAVVALDAAVERTVFFAANSRGVPYTSRTSFPDLISAVAANLGSSWRFSQRLEITRLHSARNKAQHEGLFPAQEHMGSFRTAAERLVRSLTTAVTGLDATSVVLASAVRDDELRRTLEAAAALEEAGADPLTVVQACRAAYDLVHHKWSEQTRAAGLEPHRSFGYGGAFQEFREIAEHAQQLESRLRDSADAALFSVDPGEQIWFKHLTSDANRGDVHVSQHEASRALSFVFGWTLRWEQLAALIELDRGWLARVMRRRTRATPEESPRVASVDVSSHGGDSAVLRFELHGLPEEDRFEAWAAGLQAILSEQRTAVADVLLHWTVLGDGRVEAVIYPMQVEIQPRVLPGGYDAFRVPAPPPVAEEAVTAAVHLLAEALGQVDADIAAREAAEREHRRQGEQEDEEFARTTEGRLPEWVIRLEIDRSFRNPRGWEGAEARAYLVWVEHDLDGEQVAQTVRDIPGVQQFYPTVGHSFSYIPEGDDPVAPLAAATAALRNALSDRETQMRPMREWQGRMQRAAEVATRPS